MLKKTRRRKRSRNLMLFQKTVRCIKLSSLKTVHSNSQKIGLESKKSELARKFVRSSKLDLFSQQENNLKRANQKPLLLAMMTNPY